MLHVSYVIRKSLQYCTNQEKRIKDLQERQPITGPVVSDLPVLWKIENL